MPKLEINIAAESQSDFYFLLIALKGESTAKKTRGSKFDNFCIKYAVCPMRVRSTQR
ncbi:hypothetical protein [Microcoleus sp. F4-D5]|uniref:hypothetical protein n=1 Tax=Microcoleus sp. F4-D5 TaxID=2818760 RepID=UPI002FD38397